MPGDEQIRSTHRFDAMTVRRNVVQVLGNQLHELRFTIRPNAGLEILERLTGTVDTLQDVSNILNDAF